MVVFFTFSKNALEFIFESAFLNKTVSFLNFLGGLIFTGINPVDTRRRFNVYKTSIQRHWRRKDVLQTLKLRHVSTGKVRGFCGFHKNPWNQVPWNIWFPHVWENKYLENMIIFHALDGLGDIIACNKSFSLRKNIFFLWKLFSCSKIQTLFCD